MKTTCFRNTACSSSKELKFHVGLSLCYHAVQPRLGQLCVMKSYSRIVSRQIEERGLSSLLTTNSILQKFCIPYLPSQLEPYSVLLVNHDRLTGHIALKRPRLQFVSNCIRGVGAVLQYSYNREPSLPLLLMRSTTTYFVALYLLLEKSLTYCFR